MSFLLHHVPYVELPPRVRTPEIMSRDEGCPGRVAGQIAKRMGLLAKISKVKKNPTRLQDPQQTISQHDLAQLPQKSKPQVGHIHESANKALLHISI
jgi:hypothetical protein